MAGSRKLSIEIVGDAKGVSKAFGDVEGAASGLEKKTTQSFSSFTSSIKNAEGVSGKWSAFTGGAMDQVRANAGALATAGGAAIAGFAVKALGEFQEVAKTAIDAGAAMGTSAENASRWIAVGDDFEVSASAIESAGSKIVKSLDKDVWKQYGIATRDAQGNIRDTSDVMTDALSVISAQPTEAAKAKVGMDLLGKSYSELAPLVGHTKDEYEKMLGSVEDGQVITAKEVETSERMRKAQDALSDAVGEVTLAVGKFVAEGAPAIEFFADAITKAIEWKDALDNATGPLGQLIALAETATNPIGNMNTIQEAFSDTVKETGWTLDETIAKYKEAGVTEEQLTEITNRWWKENSVARDTIEHLGLETQDAGEKADTTAGQMQTLAERTANAKQAADDMKTAWQLLKGELDQRQAFLNIQGSVDDLRAKLMLAWDAGATGAADAEQKSRDYELALVDTKNKVIDYGAQIGLLPDQVTTLLKLADNGQIDDMERRLAILARNRTMQLSLDLKGATGTFQIGAVARAKGGPVTAGMPYIVGDKHGLSHAELFVPDRDGQILPSLPQMGGGVTVVNVTVQGSVMTERDLVSAVYDGIVDGQARGVLVGSLG